MRGASLDRLPPGEERIWRKQGPMFQTEHEFTLPKGHVDAEGNVHRTGIMRLSTAADEILPLQDPRVKQNPAYLLIILLSRVVIKLGNVKQITPKTIEELFTEDLRYLQDFYNTINENQTQHIEARCPKCAHVFAVEVAPLGESSATP
jgi:hypothetical protein